MLDAYPPDLAQQPVGQARVLKEKDFPRGTNGKYSRPIKLYLQDRHATTMDMQRCPCVYPTQTGLIFKTTNEKLDKAWTIRYIPPDLTTGQRFGFPVGVDMSTHLFYLHNRDNPFRLVVVEGVFDAVRCYLAGYSSISILGSNLTQSRADYIKNIIREGGITSAVYVPDNDGPGHVAIRRLSDTRLLIPILFLPVGMKDCSSLNKKELKEFLEVV